MIIMNGPITQDKIKEISNKIVDNYNPEKIILFGSYAWGTPGPDSDVDIFIVKKTDKNIFERNREVNRIFSERNFAMDILVYTPEQLKIRNEMGDPFLRRIINSGKVLYDKQ